MRYVFLILAQCVCLSAFAQQTEWASRVLASTGEANEKKHNVDKVLGSPNTSPDPVDHPDAWELKEGASESVKVGFDRPMRASRIVVIENFHAGSITKISYTEKGGKSTVLKTYSPKAVKESRRVLVEDFPLTENEIEAVTVEFNTRAISGEQQVDAIAISTTKGPFQTIRLASDLDVNAKPERLSDAVNSPSPEIGPVITTDGNTLYFSRRNHPQNIGGKDDKEDIWYADFNPQTRTWGQAKNLGAPLNNDSYNFVSSVTPDGNMMLVGNVYLADGSEEAGASLAVRDKQGWTMPEPISIRKDRNKSDRVDYFLSASGRTLILSEERPDGRGGRDLYASFQDDKGVWSEPQSLGNIVNTGVDDYAPFLAADARTLYFSSAGHAGYGSDDIFITRRIGNGWSDWTEPENLGKPINTPGKDAYFTLPAAGSFAYYASSLGNKDAEQTDLYRVILTKSQRPKPVVLVSGKVLDKKNNQPIDANIVYEDLTHNVEVGAARTNPATGAYKIALPAGEMYGYVAKANNYFGTSANLDLTKQQDYKEMSQDLEMTPREVGAVVRINNLFFDFNKATLRPESFSELNRVRNYFKQTPGLELEIDGHCDSIGTDEINSRISKERAEAVVTYLTQNGVEPSRLTVQAFGRTKPKASNRTEEGRQLNRRVEFVVKKL